MDCMEYMRQFPDKHFELAVVDPPYGIGVTDNKSGMGRRKGDAKAKYKVGDWDSCIPNEFYFKELFRVSKQQIIWGGNYFTLPPSKCFLIWDKMFSNEVSFSAAEYAWASFDEMASIFKYHPGQPGRIHPTQKPVALYKWIFENYARPGWKILDTHLGSGSSRIAAWDMGLDFYATELDPDYFEAMEKRFQAHIARPQLFAPSEQYTFKQASIFEEP